MSNLIKPILFYDGSCPLCKKEITHYKSVDQVNNITWIDISEETATLNSYGISFHTAMQVIHGINPQGQVETGIDAFLLIWKHLPYYRYLARTIEALHLQQPLAWLYNIFSSWRYKKRCGESCNQSHH